ncbi:MAG: hypothetical protein KC933_28805 [Myxococcales bacterium]|nr:hypothetical protein [Myxococcales bacterium]MCB9647238.1 hypothetical protein [Deltaproteobacteria bacterium]
MAGAQNGFSGGKRAKERQRAEKKANKEERRRVRQAEKANTDSADGIDPDIAHIVPGPQPSALDDEDAADDTTEE